MPITRGIIALAAATVLALPACSPAPSSTSSQSSSSPGTPSADRVIAGGIMPASNALSAPRPASVSSESGAGLFGSMNCDGCHGGGAVGWVGPSLVDGRWRYGGTDQDIFTSIFYGRPKGMPAYGGVIGTDGVWMLVAYIKAQGIPSTVPTTSWLPGGNASPNPTPAPAAAATAPVPQAAVSVEQMPAKYGCTACHAADHKIVGPAFKDVAAKYKGQDVEAQLVQKVRNGGAGVWGEVPMIPNPAVPEEDLHAMIKWIVALK